MVRKSAKAINLMKSLNLPFYVVRLDLIDHGENMKNILLKWVKKEELPAVFIKGQLIGGYEELWFLHYTNLMRHVLESRVENPPFLNNFNFTYEVIVIGGGTAGIAAAVEAAKLGKKVAIINYIAPAMHGDLRDTGGINVNIGSVTKNLLYAASNYANILEGYSIEQSMTDTPDWKKLMSDINEHIRIINFKIRCQLKECGVDYYYARGRFLNSHTVQITFPNSQQKFLTTSVTIVATGSRPRYPKYIQGEKVNCFTTDDFFKNKNPPGKTLILTSTYIGLECATILANLNYPVTVVAEPPISKDIDNDVLRRAKSHMKQKKIVFLEKVQIECIENFDDLENKYKLKVTGLGECQTPYEDYFTTVLFEYGRVPATDHLGLCKIGIKLDALSRKILIDDYGRTNINNIFAVGDVAYGWPELASAAQKGAKFLIETLYKGTLTGIGLKFVPERIILPVEYAHIGETEQSALTKYGNKVKCYEAESSYCGVITNSQLRNYFYLKVVCLDNDNDEEVISVHLLCYGAAEIIQGLSILLRKGLTKKELDNAIGFPSIFCEVLPSMKLRPVRSLSELIKPQSDHLKMQILEKAMNEVEPLRRKPKVPPEPLYPLDEKGKDESELEKMYKRNKEPSSKIRKVEKEKSEQDVEKLVKVKSRSQVISSVDTTDSSTSSSSSTGSSTCTSSSDGTSSSSSSSSTSDDNSDATMTTSDEDHDESESNEEISGVEDIAVKKAKL